MPRKTATAEALPPQPETMTALVALDSLYLHPINPRKEPPSAEIEALAASIKAVGLLQNLSGFADRQIRFRPGHDAADPDHIGIVAGGRRLRALQLLASRGEWSAPVPVLITEEPDQAAEWAGAENESHSPLTVADRIIAYRQMRDRGHSVDAIAAAFGKPVSDVRRQLALACLPDAALDALRSGAITYDTAKALTTARTAEQQERLINGLIEGKITAWDIRNEVQRGTVRSTDPRAIFVGAAYHEAGGASTLDFFADHTILHDEGLLDRLMQEKGEAEAEAIRAAEGWAWAQFLGREMFWEAEKDLTKITGETMPLPEGDQARMLELEERPDDLTEAELAELDALQDRAETPHFTDTDRESAGILIRLDNDGTLSVRRAYRRKGDRPANDPNADTVEIGPASLEPAMPQNLKDDLRAIRLICIQDALRRDLDLCKTLLAMQIAGVFRPWDAPFAMTPHHSQRHPIAPPPAKMDGLHIPKALQASPVVDTEEDATTDPLGDWLSESPGIINSALANGLARAFCRWDGPIVQAIHWRNGVTPRALWTPTAAGFLSRVSVGYLDALWRELVPEDAATSARDGFFSLTKKEKAQQLHKLFEGHDLREMLGLSREAGEKIDAWLPEDLRIAGKAEEGAEE